MSCMKQIGMCVYVYTHTRYILDTPHTLHTVNIFLSILVLKLHLLQNIKKQGRVNLNLLYTKIYWQALSALSSEALKCHILKSVRWVIPSRMYLSV